MTSADVVGPDRAPPLEEEQLPTGVRGAWERSKLNLRTGNLGPVPLSGVPPGAPPESPGSSP